MKTTEDRAVPLSLDAAPRRMARRTVVMVASPGAEPTRADVAFNLASVCAEVGQRVAVVSTFVEDRPTPIRTGPFDEGEPVLTDPAQEADVRDLLADSSVPRVSLLNLQDLVSQPTPVEIPFQEILETLRNLVDVVILDVPSLLTVHHGQAMAPLADVVLVVAERRFTTVDQLRRVKLMLRRLDAPVAGMALTKGRVVRDSWLDEDEPMPISAAERPAIELGPEETDGSAAGPSDGEAAAAVTGHRQRRPVVEHGSLALGTRSDQPADRDSPTPQA